MDAASFPGHAIMTVDSLNDLIELAEEAGAPDALVAEMFEYASFELPLVLPLHIVKRWHKGARKDG